MTLVCGAVLLAALGVLLTGEAAVGRAVPREDFVPTIAVPSAMSLPATSVIMSPTPLGNASGNPCSGAFFASDCLVIPQCSFCCSRPIGQQCVPVGQCLTSHALPNASTSCFDLCSSSADSDNDGSAQASHGNGSRDAVCESCVAKLWCYYCLTSASCISPRDKCSRGAVVQMCDGSPGVSILLPAGSTSTWYRGVVYATITAAALLGLIAVYVVFQQCRHRLQRLRLRRPLRHEGAPLLSPSSRAQNQNDSAVASLGTTAASTTMSSHATNVQVDIAEMDRVTEGPQQQQRGGDGAEHHRRNAQRVDATNSPTSAGESSSAATLAVEENGDETSRVTPAAAASTVLIGETSRGEGEPTTPPVAESSHDGASSVGALAALRRVPSSGSVDSDSQCQLCYDAAAVIAFLPCYHVHCCMSCANHIRPNQPRMELHCPFCREAIQSMVRLTSIIQKKLD